MADFDGSTGVEWRLYINTGTYAAPTWSEVSAAKDISMPDDSDEIETPERGARYKLWQVGQGDLSIEFPATYRRARASQVAVRGHYDAQTDCDILLVDGDVATADNEGMRMISKCVSFGNSLGMTDGAEIAMRFRPTYNTDQPSPTRVTMPIT